MEHDPASKSPTHAADDRHGILNSSDGARETAEAALQAEIVGQRLPV